MRKEFFCPVAPKLVTAVTVVSETVDFLECYEDDCAMWQDGQCWKRG